MKRLQDNQKGAALLTVLVAMMIISIMLFEFQYSAMVERKLAYNDLHQLQAYYLAKAGARIGLLRVSLYGKARVSPDIKNSIPAAFLNYLDLIWQMPLPPFPPDTSKLAKLTLDEKNAAEQVLEQTRISDGTFTHVITNEGSKINLNQLMVPTSKLGERIDFTAQPTTMYQYVGKVLVTLLDNFLKESDDPRSEYGDMRPEEVVTDIMDWINPGSNRFMGGVKDVFYEQQNPPYKAKRGKFYSLEELRLVRGIDEHLYNKLKPHVTVYSEDGKINLNTAGETMYKAIYGGFTDDDIKRLLEERNLRGGWASEADFIKYATVDLNRPALKDVYPDAANYPFTVAGKSFVIESMGTIKRSGSQIQKVIRIGVALTSPKGGQRLTHLRTEQDCTKAGKLWFKEGFTCFEVPTTEDECTRGQIPGATWEPVGSQMCCRPLRNQAPTCPPQGASGPGAAAAAPVEAESMKILHWSES